MQPLEKLIAEAEVERVLVAARDGLPLRLADAPLGHGCEVRRELGADEAPPL